MSSQPAITPTNQRSWINRHNTFRQAIDNLFDITNGDTGNVLNDYNATTVAIGELIGRATRENRRIRALGGGWSFSKVAATDGWLLNTKLLNLLAEMRPENVVTSYPEPGQLLFAQCGVSVKELNTYLSSTGRSLKTCGASNGQTIVGAFSTGTHGSAIDVGATPDFILGMHLLVSETQHIWLERASRPVVSDAFVDKLHTQLVRDDELFNAALVGLGAFGFIHGLMLATEKRFLLESFRIRLPFDASLKHLMQTLDFSRPNNLPYGSERPFHFQVVVNQYDLAKGVYVTVMYKRAYTSAYTRPVVNTGKAGPGDDVPAVLGRLTDGIPLVTPLIVNQLIKSAFPIFTRVFGTLGEIFTNTDTRGKVLSTAVGIDVANATRVNDLLISLNRSKGPFAGVFSYRYVKQSGALLAFTKFPCTCIVELDGVESPLTRAFYQAFWDTLRAQGIPFTFHWGKIGTMNAATLTEMYGVSRDKWISARNRLMPEASMNVFSSPLLAEWELDSIHLHARPF